MTRRLLFKRWIFPAMVLGLLLLLVLGIGNLVRHGGTALESMSASAYETFTGDTEAAGRIYDRNGVLLWGQEKPADRSLFSLLGAPYPLITNCVVYQYQEVLRGWDHYNLWQGADSLEGAGSDLFLTLDNNVQQTVSRLLEENAVSGFAAACDASTGALLCLVSTPTAAPGEDVETLPDGALLNKCLYAPIPGSTMKIITTALLVEQAGPEVLTAYRYTCRGLDPLSADGTAITCGTRQGEQDLISALGNSCNTYFSSAVQTFLSPERTQEALARYGFQPERQSLGLLTRRGSSIPFQDLTFSSVWSLIGQVSEVSPLDMLRFTAALAHEGQAPTLYLVERQSRRENPVLGFQCKPERETILSADNANAVLDLWTQAYETYYDTANYPAVLTAAKTGTAQLGDGSVNKLLLGYSAELDVVFLLCLENWEDGMLSPKAVAGTLLNALGETP